MTAMSTASTIGDTWNRQLLGANERIEPRPLPVGMRFSPPSLATLDLPQGKVLMVVEDAIMALDLQRLLNEAGYRVVGPATTVGEIQSMIQRGISTALSSISTSTGVPRCPSRICWLLPMCPSSI